MSEMSAVGNAVPAPALTSESEASAILGEFYGLDATAKRVSSELDETFIARAQDGTRMVLKIASPAERRDILEFQAGALLHLAGSASDLPVPRMIAGRDGNTIQLLMHNGLGRFVRLLSYLDGDQLSAIPANAPAQLEQLGRLLGRLDAALGSFQPMVPAFDLVWDITHADRIIPMAHQMAAPEERALTLRAFDDFLATVKPRQSELPSQIIHNDLNPHNVLVASDDPSRISGVIDFGDMVEAPRVNDPAVALSYFIGKPDGTVLIAAFMRGYRPAQPLTPLEQSMLPTLVRARLAMTVALTEYRAARHPERAAYIVRNRPGSLSGLRRMAAMTPSETEAAFSGADT